MELSSLTWGGVPLWVWLLIFAIGFGVRAAYRDWRQNRISKKEIDEAERRFREKYRWQPKMVGGVDCGEWVRKDGQPWDDDDE